MWQTALSELRLRMTEATFETWLSGSRATGLNNGVLTVTLPNQYAREWCATRLLPTMRRSLRHVTGQDLEIEFRVAGASRREA
jgi:chromosomal replication initiator protein